MAGKFDKEILCIKKDTFFRSGSWEGFQQENLDEIYKLLLTESEFKLRADLEENREYLQIIPQVVLKFGETYYLHKQVNRNEKRLNSLCPLPLGGHVSEFELDKNSTEDSIQQALQRELREEVTTDFDVIKKTFLGVIYLDDNPVNSVHVGVVYVFEVSNNSAKVREEGLDTVGWMTVEYLKEHRDELTYWSRMIIDYL